MTNAKISSKGRALLKKRASAKVARAIVGQGARLSSHGQIEIKVGDKKIIVRSASAA